MSRIRLFTMLFMLAPLTPQARAESAEEPQPLDLAARLIDDGYLERAEKVLSKIAPDANDVDRARYWTLFGLIDLKKSAFAQAHVHFNKASDAGSKDPFLDVYKAQAYFGQKDYHKCLEHFANVPQLYDSIPKIHLLRARSLWFLGRKGEGWQVLEDAHSRHRDLTAFLLEKLRLLNELGFYEESLRLARQGYQNSTDLHFFKNLALVYRETGPQAAMLEVLEAAHLRFPKDLAIKTQLALTYAQQENNLIAARLFEEAAELDIRFKKEAAELYMKCKRYFKALALNAQMVDQKSKLRQRLAILIRMGEFEKAAAMHPALSRWQILEDPQIRYALAYAYFKYGDFANAKKQLALVRSGQLMDKVSRLRQQMLACKESPWECSST